MDVEDREFGKGRRNDSSSSPESSPRQPKKRSFSPTSDDGDLVVPLIADDDTPPPSERPLIRQAMAFTWSGTGTTVAAPPSLNTYEMILPPTTRPSHDTLFLPGQGVIPSTRSSRRRTKQMEGSRKKKKKNDYGGQTTRFRLDPQIGLRSSEPVISHRPSEVPIRSIPESSTFVPPSAPILPSSYGGDNVPPALQFPPAQAISMSASKIQPASAMQSMPSATRWKTTDLPLAEGPNRLALSDPLSPPRSGTPASDGNVPRESHYRRDYEKGVTLREPGLSRGVHEAATRASGQLPSPTAPRHREERIKEGKRTQKAPGLMLTLLIQDIRSGIIDHQLAEVKVPMKVASDPKDGFWADAKTLGEQLQSSASRIDGPAKVYTLRGKYRQFFLRVSADNRDEFISTHLAIKPDRMLDVVVEELLPPGQLPQPPKIPPDLIVRTPSPSSTSESPSSERDSVQPRMRSVRSYERLMTELETYRRRYGSLQHSPEPAARGRKSRTAEAPKDKQSPGRRSESAESIPSALMPTGIRFPSPDDDDSLEEVDRLITEAVEQIVQEDDDWTVFFRVKAAHEPHRVMDVLAQYKIVKRMLDMFAGKKVPFQSFKARIEPKHITQALKIEDPKFSSNCVETLRLLDLYGENGRHYADFRVVEMVKDTCRPDYNAKPIKRLLHLMQDIDKKWKEGHPSAEPSTTQV